MKGSIQETLTRVRPPRVQITYDVETGGAIERKELPFIAGIFADLTGDRDPQKQFPPVKAREMVEIDRDSFDDVLKASEPQVLLSDIKNVLPGGSGKLAGFLKFNKLEDFEPLNVVKNIPVMAALYHTRTNIRTLQTKMEASDNVTTLLDTLVDPKAGKAQRDELIGAFPADKPETWSKVTPTATLKTLLTPEYMLNDPSQQETCLEILGQFTVNVLANLDAKNTLGAAALMDNDVANTDQALSLQVNAVMHSKVFKELEATWRGMAYLVFRSETGEMLKLRVLNITKEELRSDMDKAVEFDQSAIFKMIYEAEYGTYGGNPYSLLVGGFEFDRSPMDMDLLNKIAQVAAASHAPFISAADSKLFDLDSFEKLAKPRDLAKIFESLEMAEWKSFRESEDSRYVSLALPRVLLRLPYGPKTDPVNGLAFEEDVNAPDTSKFLWGNAVYMMAERITNAFALYGWTAAIRGVEGGGLVDGLPVYTYKTANGDEAMICPTQVSITDRREKELNDLGFLAICHCKGTNEAAFFGGQTTNQPKQYLSDEATSNAALSSRLPYILAASRFAHYVKVLMREKIGSFMTRANVEHYLNDWVSQYVLLDDDATQDVKAKYPLRGAKITVTDVPGKPGSYKATMFLRPHFQLEELTTSIRMVADLPG